MTQFCPVCVGEIYTPSGHVDCDFVIIEEFPELVKPSPAVSGWQREEWTPRKIMNNELSKVGLSLNQFKIYTVYMHDVPENGKPNTTCYDFGLEFVLKEIMTANGVIILGDNLCKYMTGFDLKSVKGLSKVPSQYLPDGNIPRMFLPTIRSIYSTGAGEFGIGLKRFANQIGVV